MTTARLRRRLMILGMALGCVSAVLVLVILAGLVPDDSVTAALIASVATGSAGLAIFAAAAEDPA